MKQEKLVRDNIPELIRSQGKQVKTHIATEEEYWEKLQDKVAEEMAEFQAEPGIAEFVDVLEVLDAVASYKKFDRSEVEKFRQEKAKERGTFSKRVILDNVE
jgi:predicted house-cleaning noncanonical NTP pyrophosphatase (MazG superfamily)